MTADEVKGALAHVEASVGPLAIALRALTLTHRELTGPGRLPVDHDLLRAIAGDLVDQVRAGTPTTILVTAHAVLDTLCVSRVAP